MGFTKVEAAGLSTTGSYTIENINITGVVTATSFVGDISQATGAAAGLGTALSEDQSNPLNKIYYTDTVLSVGSTQTVNPPDSSNIAYTQYAEIAVEEGYDLIVEDGDDLIPDILGLSSTTAGVLPGAGGRVRADNFTDKAGAGAPTFPNGVNVTGVATATTFSGNLTGDVTGNVTGNLTGSSVNVTGVITATSFSGDGSNLTGIDSTALVDSDSTTRVQANTSGAVVTGILTASSRIEVGDKFISSSGVGIGTTTTTGRNAGVGTVAGTLIYNATAQQLEVFDGSQWIGGLKSPLSATGGTKDTTSRTGYAVHTFTGSAETFDVIGGDTDTTVEIMLVGGGAGGGRSPNYQGGGGGAGALVYKTGVPVSVGSYPISVGGGGASDSNGTPTTGLSYTAPGGGHGASEGPGGNRPAESGGSGGGGSWPGLPGASGTGATGGSGDSTTPDAGFGHPAGNGAGSGGSPNSYSGAGGGGAGASSSNASSSNGTPGGNGLAYTITGSSTTYAGGGGGSHRSGTSYPGGTGGGGASDTDATDGTGGGGGNRASGGSGVVIIAYPTA